MNRIKKNMKRALSAPLKCCQYVSDPNKTNIEAQVKSALGITKLPPMPQKAVPVEDVENRAVKEQATTSQINKLKEMELELQRQKLQNQKLYQNVLVIEKQIERLPYFMRFCRLFNYFLKIHILHKSNFIKMFSIFWVL